MTELIMIPGLLCTGELFAPQRVALGSSHNIAIADHTSHDTLTAMAEALLSAAPSQFALAGLSLGGYLAFEVLRQAPERVTRLALMNTNARADRPEQSEQRHALTRLAADEGLEAVQEILTPLLIHPDRLDDSSLTATISRMANEVGLAAFKRQQAAITRRRDNRGFLKEIRCPVLIVVGAEDRLTPPKVAKEMAAGINGAHLVEIPHCGHLSTLEAPDAVNDALVAWFAA